MIGLVCTGTGCIGIGKALEDTRSCDDADNVAVAETVGLLGLLLNGGKSGSKAEKIGQVKLEVALFLELDRIVEISRFCSTELS